jgi:hypothetical protein
LSHFSGPIDLQLIFNPPDAIQVPHHFLGHLLLEERAHGSFDAHEAVGGFDMYPMVGNVRAAAEGALNLV